jgi:hypothetical protein
MRYMLARRVCRRDPLPRRPREFCGRGPKLALAEGVRNLEGAKRTWEGERASAGRGWNERGTLNASTVENPIWSYGQSALIGRGGQDEVDRAGVIVPHKLPTYGEWRVVSQMPTKTRGPADERKGTEANRCHAEHITSPAQECRPIERSLSENQVGATLRTFEFHPAAFRQAL